ncbi:MAG: beta-galactosidase [bacterium]|nr:beta-galactosidase [bacterium]
MKLEEMKCFLHGADYNPDQWLDRPAILKEDIRLMKKAGVNVVSLGIFAWSTYEPNEGVFNFKWLDNIIDTLYKNGIYVILSTPSSAIPPWLSKKYPEVMLTKADRVRRIHGDRSFFCKSGIYRKKVEIIDRQLAERYARHPALIMWHISNEMYGNCHCQTCQQKFREWLKQKYRTIDNLNKQYWSAFWSHGYSDWDEIESPSASIGESTLSPLAVDYNRFYSDVSIDFLNMEINTVKEYNSDIPVTTNMFHHNCGINYQKLSDKLDVISWDSYPRWHCGTDKTTEWDNAVRAAFDFDYCRTLKQKPFYLMESVPSVPSQFEVCKLKRPKMHMLSAMQAVAFGSNSVQYFQWRKGRGGYEKFHGAVVGHDGTENTRVFNDVKEVGKKLTDISELKGTTGKCNAAIIFDWENMRVLEGEVALKRNKNFHEIIYKHYEALLKNYASVDIISVDDDFSRYKMIAAPSLYSLKPGISDKIREFIENGGHFVLTYNSGIVNENDIAFECFPPYSLNDVFGVECEETDALAADDYNEIVYAGKIYKALDFCELIHTSAEVVGEYATDFYAGKAAVTKKQYGKGAAYYLACHTDDEFLHDFYHNVISEAGVYKIDVDYVQDVMIKERNGHIFLMNFSTEQRSVHIDDKKYTLDGYDYLIL